MENEVREEKSLSQLNVTSLDDLQNYAQGTIVQLPDFAEGQPFIARLKRPSLLFLAKTGKIPNQLLKPANELFLKGGAGADTEDLDMMKQMYDVMETIAKSSLVKPTFEDITNAGIILSDEQLMAIFNYSQEGAKALKSFRQE